MLQHTCRPVVLHSNQAFGSFQTESKKLCSLKQIRGDMMDGLEVPSFTRDKSFCRYKEEVSHWLAVTKEEKEKRGLLLALALPEDAPRGFFHQVVGPTLGLEKLTGEDGADVFVHFLHKEFEGRQASFRDAYNSYRNIQTLTRKCGQTMESYILEFENRLADARRMNVVYSGLVEAFVLLDGANMSDSEKQEMIDQTTCVDGQLSDAPEEIKSRLKSLIKSDTGDSSISHEELDVKEEEKDLLIEQVKSLVDDYDPKGDGSRVGGDRQGGGEDEEDEEAADDPPEQGGCDSDNDVSNDEEKQSRCVCPCVKK